MTHEKFLSLCKGYLDNESDPLGDEELDLSFKHGRMTEKGFEMYRHYTASILFYPQNKTHFAMIENVLSKNYNFGVIIHNHDLKENNNSDKFMDEDEEDFDDLENSVPDDDDKLSFKKTHGHLILHFANTRTNTAVAKDLKISSRYVRVYSKLSSSILYLIHRDYQNKYQYCVDDVCGPLSCQLGKLDVLYARDECDILKEILESIINVPHDRIIDIAEFSLNLLNMGYHPHVQQKYFYLINNAINQHNRWAGEFKKNY